MATSSLVPRFAASSGDGDGRLLLVKGPSLSSSPWRSSCRSSDWTLPLLRQLAVPEVKARRQLNVDVNSRDKQVGRMLILQGQEPVGIF